MDSKTIKLTSQGLRRRDDRRRNVSQPTQWPEHPNVQPPQLAPHDKPRSRNERRPDSPPSAPSQYQTPSVGNSPIKRSISQTGSTSSVNGDHLSTPPPHERPTLDIKKRSTSSVGIPTSPIDLSQLGSRKAPSLSFVGPTKPNSQAEPVLPLFSDNDSEGRRSETHAEPPDHNNDTPAAGSGGYGAHTPGSTREGSQSSTIGEDGYDNLPNGTPVEDSGSDVGNSMGSTDFLSGYCAPGQMGSCLYKIADHTGTTDCISGFHASSYLHCYTPNGLTWTLACAGEYTWTAS
ncbi:hypothetical protein BJ508DRAFT_332148 [Ascobolus immersus RN42]|uniref:Uncharacterized protein n=1 Tax=Ascobolus immersus RN42 TaxID=1160509 RepID=A0A3N4HNL8_ASCIM|nr:hypothetical protein BJ508DRAFT_332148 [Ascobolus immersus RN42]